MEIINIPISALREYERNPRRNEDAVQAVANSIQEFGFKVPVVVDAENTILAGHTRLKAAALLGMEEVPCIRADDLTPEQARAFRLADNKTGELALWDFDKLEDELAAMQDIQWSDFGFLDDADEDIYDDAPEPLEESYAEPEVAKLKCPHCGHVDSKARFRPV